jgi:hypothetical protein
LFPDWPSAHGAIAHRRGDRWFEKARSAYPRHPQYHAYLASAYALKGDTERAAVELVEARRLSGDDRYSSIARLKATAIYLVPEALALFETTFFAGLRKECWRNHHRLAGCAPQGSWGRRFTSRPGAE